MHSDLTEEEMRRALFGETKPVVPAPPLMQAITPEVVVAQPVKAMKKSMS